MLGLATDLEQLDTVVIIYATRVMNCFLEEYETVVVSATSSCGARGERPSSSSALFANDHGAKLLELFSDEQVFHRALVMSLTLSDFSAACMQEALSTLIATVSSPVSYSNDHCESVELTFFHRAVKGKSINSCQFGKRRLHQVCTSRGGRARRGSCWACAGRVMRNQRLRYHVVMCITL